jgi:hypothetical protein
MKLRVTLIYTYEVNPDYYPHMDALDMATCDIESDPIVVLQADEWKIESAVLSDD